MSGGSGESQKVVSRVARAVPSLAGKELGIGPEQPLTPFEARSVGKRLRHRLYLSMSRLVDVSLVGRRPKEERS